MSKDKCPICNKELKDVARHLKSVHKVELKQEEMVSQGISIYDDINIKKTYATRTFTTITEFDFRITFMNTKTRIEDKDVFLGEGLVYLTPVAAKELHFQLSELIASWEKDNGKIKSRPQKSVFTNMVIQ